MLRRPPPGVKACGNLLQLFVDQPKEWDAWNIDADFIKQHTDIMRADKVKLIEHTPLHARMDPAGLGRSGAPSPINHVSWRPAHRRPMQPDWHEKHKLLKVAFPLSVHNDMATFEIPYGSIERPTTRGNSRHVSRSSEPRWTQ